MGIDSEQLRHYVIRPTLKYLGLYSRSAEELLIGTAAVESQGGRYLHQLNNGPAHGIFQMEPDTHEDIWGNYLDYRQPLSDSIRNLGGRCSAEDLIGNLCYATAMARVHYLRVPMLLPGETELMSLAKYWKDHYNTHKGAGSTRDFVDAYKRYTS